jgi:hypothetical protein
MDSEEDILKALFVNERTMAGLSHWVSEHQQIRSLLMAEMVRRSTVSEQWRHMLPKYMLPIFSMIQASGATQKMARVNGALFNRIRDAIIEWSQGALTRDLLSEAAKRTEDEFLTALKGDYASRMGAAQKGVGPIADEHDGGSTSDQNDIVPSDTAHPKRGSSLYGGESFEDGQQRLGGLLLSAREDLKEIGLQTDLVSEEDVEAAGKSVENLMKVESLGGGVNQEGHLVFKSIGEFFGRLKIMETVGYAPSNLPDSLTDLAQKPDTDIFVPEVSHEKIPERNVLDDGDFIPVELPTEGRSRDGLASPHSTEDAPDRPEEELALTAENEPDIISYRENLAGIIPVKLAQTDMVGTGSEPVSEPVTKPEPSVTPEPIAVPVPLTEPTLAPTPEPAPEPNPISAPISEPAQIKPVAVDVAASVDRSGDRTDAPQTPSGVSDAVDEIDIIIPDGDRGLVAMAPEWVSHWPVSMAELEIIADKVPRSTGISRSHGNLTSRQAFAGWAPHTRDVPYGHMMIRRHHDMSVKAGKEGDIHPIEWSRPEMPEGSWQATVARDTSRVLGRSHPLMLPPNSSLAWYGGMLGWSEVDIRSLAAFGSPARPESVTAKGDPAKLVEAMRGVVRMQLQQLLVEAPSHYLSEQVDLKKRHEIACQHLSRWWIFMLLARHRMEDFDLIFTREFFGGTDGPDFFVEPTGAVNFGTSQWSSHAMLHRKGKFGDTSVWPRALSGSLVSGPPPRP